MSVANPLRMLITAGPTREYLDPVRYLSNRSSGKMGYALAEAARDWPARVTLVSGPTVLPPPAGVEFVAVTTAAEMAAAVFAAFDATDLVIMAAAVCDFRPRRVAEDKIKKHAFGGVLELEPTIDILAELGRRRQRQVIVGFAVETHDLERYAREKLHRKGADLIVANNVSAFDADRNAVSLVGRDGETVSLPEMSKRDLARELIRRAVALVP